MLEKTLESPLDCGEIQLVHPKGNQYWIFIGRTDAKAEAPILWLPDVKNWLIRKDPDAGKDWRREEEGTTDGWMASPTQWTWIWVNSGSCWWTGRPGVLQSIGLQRVRHNWATELNCDLELKHLKFESKSEPVVCNPVIKDLGTHFLIIIILFKKSFGYAGRHVGY